MSHPLDGLYATQQGHLLMLAVKSTLVENSSELYGQIKGVGAFEEWFPFKIAFTQRAQSTLHFVSFTVSGPRTERYEAFIDSFAGCGQAQDGRVDTLLLMYAGSTVNSNTSMQFWGNQASNGQSVLCTPNWAVLGGKPFVFQRTAKE